MHRKKRDRLRTLRAIEAIWRISLQESIDSRFHFSVRWSSAVLVAFDVGCHKDSW
jgi:hypothetical protein